MAVEKVILQKCLANRLSKEGKLSIKPGKCYAVLQPSSNLGCGTMHSLDFHIYKEDILALEAVQNMLTRWIPEMVGLMYEPVLNAV